MKFPKNLIPNYHRFPISKWGNSVYFTTNYKLEVGMEYKAIRFTINLTELLSGLRYTSEEAQGPKRGKRVPGAEINRL
ncbi:hypothetical protein, partial [Neobacillus cucumis]|uniref:hypothetical protein n=1 Tax=Neobacillus cucumis TaxID=1740721 RepID=UPI002E1C4D17|nr:hypothetical protein [Neobacillus cucumis]